MNATMRAARQGWFPDERPGWLDDRSWSVLQGRRRGESLTRIADRMGVTRQRVWQLEKRSLAYIRRGFGPPPMLTDREGPEWASRPVTPPSRGDPSPGAPRGIRTSPMVILFEGEWAYDAYDNATRAMIDRAYVRIRRRLEAEEA